MTKKRSKHGRPGTRPAKPQKPRAKPDDRPKGPRPSLEVPVAATAWHRRLLCGEVEPKTLRRFIDAYVNKGPERVPR